MEAIRERKRGVGMGATCLEGWRGGEVQLIVTRFS